MFFDVVPLRLLPALLAAAIVYPMSGLRHDAPDWSLPASRWPGPAAAGMFVAGLCLVNIVAATMSSALGIVCRSSGAALPPHATHATHATHTHPAPPSEKVAGLTRYE